MLQYRVISGATLVLLAGSFASSILLSTAAPQTSAQTPSQTTAPAQAPAPAQTTKPAATGSASRYKPDRFAGRAETYYQLIWGVDSLSVKWAESGEVIRFSFRVVDAEKAKPLNDKNFEPSLIDPKAGVKLVIPALEKIGKLRQTNTPEAGKSYWMAFSNKGRLVKRGDHVDVEIGKFRAQGLVVD
jgi:hypothetical protein